MMRLRVYTRLKRSDLQIISTTFHIVDRLRKEHTQVVVVEALTTYWDNEGASPFLGSINLHSSSNFMM